MAFWRRRPKGRHALGATVPLVPVAPVQAAPLPLPVPPAFVAAPAYQEPAYAEAAPAAVEWSFPELRPPAPAPAAPGPRVELTFRDGSSASLDPIQARALEEIAQVLTRRD